MKPFGRIPWAWTFCWDGKHEFVVPIVDKSRARARGRRELAREIAGIDRRWRAVGRRGVKRGSRA